MRVIEKLFFSLFIIFIFSSCATFEKYIHIQPKSAVVADTALYVVPVSVAKRMLIDPTLPSNLLSEAEAGTDIAAWGFAQSWSFYCDFNGRMTLISKSGSEPIVSEYSEDMFSVTNDGFKIIMNENTIVQFKEDEGKFYRVRAKVGSKMLEGSGTTLWHYQLNREWKLLNFEGKSVSTLNVRKEPTIKFDMLLGKIGGFSGCNYYGGKVTFKNNTFKAGPLMMTKMACVNSDFETKYQAFLNQGEVAVDIKDNLLKLTNGVGKSCTFVLGN